MHSATISTMHFTPSRSSVFDTPSSATRRGHCDANSTLVALPAISLSALARLALRSGMILHAIGIRLLTLLGCINLSRDTNFTVSTYLYTS
jgi:hypothetical protein